ncbi:hypothetical protein [Paenibacillus sp.]|uniref:hypothetical protein n=1 Tax=Paenibacillus sp. TaxID=58172 RepID=UPI0028113EBB|nr:hypothetical protein [Paenibacillus sp.]
MDIISRGGLRARLVLVLVGATIVFFGVAGAPAAGAEGRTFAPSAGGPERVEERMAADPSGLELLYPRGTVATLGSEAVVLFQAPEGVPVAVADGDEARWSGTGLGEDVPVRAVVTGLAAGGVHALRLVRTDTSESVPLPLIVAGSYAAFDIRDVATLAARIGDTTAWDFDGDGASETSAAKAADLAALMGLIEPAVAAGANALRESLWDEETGSGLWRVYASASGLRNEAVGKYVEPQDEDGSEGFLPTSPFSGEALWYGSATVTNSVYAVGNYMNEMSEYGYELDGGTSADAHGGTIWSPSFQVAPDPDATLSFWSWWEIESANPDGYDRMSVRVQPEDGTTRTFVLNPDDGGNESPSYKPYTSGGADAAPAWRRYEFPLGEWAGQRVRVALSFETGDEQYNGFRGWFVDQVYAGTNRAPVATGVSVTGEAAVGGLLSAAAEASDPDGDALGAAKYVWQATDKATNARKVVGYGKELPVLPAYAGKLLTVEAYPYDGKEYGSAASATVQVGGPVD